jgi:hypothetical protein
MSSVTHIDLKCKEFAENMSKKLDANGEVPKKDSINHKLLNRYVHEYKNMLSLSNFESGEDQQN